MSENLKLLPEGVVPASDSYTFFVRWKIKLPNARIDGSSGRLMIPMRDTARNVRNIAYIDILGDATFLHADSDIRGLYYGLTGKKEVIGIAKNFLTGAEYHELTGHAVAIAFRTENVAPVAKALQEKYLAAQVILIEDYDIVPGPKPTVATAEARAAGADTSAPLPEVDQKAPEAISDARELLEWINRKSLKAVTKKQVMQYGPNRIRNAMSAKAALDTLVKKGWLVTEDESRYHVTPIALPASGEGPQRSA